MTKPVAFNVTKDERATIRHIVERADAIARGMGVMLDRLALTMDLEATHSNGCPLKLAELLAADDFNFTHDVGGIMKHIDRRTGKLGGCFVPRFAAIEGR